jgi:hypothetical protein
MALEKHAVIEKTGFEGKLIAKNAYWKIDKINGDKNSMSVEICATANGQQVERFVSVFNPSLDGKNFIAQAYDYLKTLPEFAGAIDC